MLTVGGGVDGILAAIDPSATQRLFERLRVGQRCGGLRALLGKGHPCPVAGVFIVVQPLAPGGGVGHGQFIVCHRWCVFVVGAALL